MEQDVSCWQGYEKQSFTASAGRSRKATFRTYSIEVFLNSNTFENVYTHRSSSPFTTDSRIDLVMYCLLEKMKFDYLNILVRIDLRSEAISTIFLKCTLALYIKNYIKNKNLHFKYIYILWLFDLFSRTFSQLGIHINLIHIAIHPSVGTICNPSLDYEHLVNKW